MTDQTVKPRTMLAIADAWIKLDPPAKLRIRELSPQLARNVDRLARDVRAGGVEIDTDEYLSQLEAERRHTYTAHVRDIPRALCDPDDGDEPRIPASM